MKTLPKLGLIISLAIIGLILKANVKPAVAQGPGIEGPFVGSKVRAVSFDGDVRRLPRVPQAAFHNTRESPVHVPRTLSGATLPDTVLQSQMGTLAMPSPNQSFKGLDKATWGTEPDPDANGDVGVNYYIQLVNSAIGIYSKTGMQLAALSLNSLFTANGGTGTLCDNNNQQDPVVVYDAAADRWVIQDSAYVVNSTGNLIPPFYECVAVSKTGNPVTGGWWLYAFVADANLLNDYPRLAVWPDGYYMSANMIYRPTWTVNRVRVWALNRTSLLNGSLQSISFDLPCNPSCYGTLLPSNLRGTPPPAGSPDYFASVSPPGSFYLWQFHADWNNPQNSTFTGPTTLAVANFSYYTKKVPEKNGNGLDAWGDRMMMQLQYRNIGGTESLWVNHTVTSGCCYAGIRWYEIRNPSTNPLVYQQGTFFPDPNYRWMGSQAVDGNGDMALGYSTSNGALFPSIRYAGRLVTDPLGVLGQGETTLYAGTGSQSGNGAWGDFTAMTVDPVDDCTFWYTNEYYDVTGLNWQTQIGSFKFPSCSAVPTPTPTVANSPTSTATTMPTSTATNTPTNTPLSTDTPTAANTATATNTPTNTPLPTNTPTSTNTLVPTATPTDTPLPTDTPTSSNTATNTPLPPTNTPTSTSTANATATITPINGIADDEATSIQYGPWRGVQDPNVSGGTYRVTNVTGGYISFAFSGTSVTWVSLTGPDQGQGQVLIDGTSKGTFDMYSAAVQYGFQQTFSGLSNSQHTITVKVAGTKNPASSDFNVAVDAFIVGGTTTQENTIAAVYNTWSGTAAAGALGGNYRWNPYGGASAQFTFVGTGVNWITAKGPSYGQANVFIDGVQVGGTIDLYAASQQWQAPITFGNLSNSQHTIQIKTTGTKNPSSSGLTVVIDAFTGPIMPIGAPISSSPPIPISGNSTIGNEDASVQYDDWSGMKDPNASGGSYRLSGIKGDKATFKFSGTAVTWISVKSPDGGRAQVLIDGVNKGTFDMYSPNVQYNVRQNLGPLAKGGHTLVLKVLGQKNQKAIGYNVSVDAFAVGNAIAQSNSPSIQYDDWTGRALPGPSAGSYRSNGRAGAEVRLAFYGTSISWITAKGPAYGKAKVFIDGVQVGNTIDLYARSQQWRVPVNFGGLSNGQHTLEIRPTGTKNTASKGTDIIVDSFSGPIVPLPQGSTHQDPVGALTWFLVGLPLGLVGLGQARRLV